MNEPLPELAHKQTSVVKTLWPSQAGTLKLVRRFGSALVCVRYRHDATGLRRLTTVELVVDEAPVASRQSDRRVYGVRIGLHENELQARVKAHGAKWDKPAKLWRMRGRAIKLLKLYTRVVEK
jgi:hypothetical protein